MPTYNTSTPANADFEHRKWWIAGLLTLFLSGTGYLYAGHPKRFISYVFIVLSASVVIGLIGFRLDINPQIILAITFIVVIFQFLTVIDSSIKAFKQNAFQKKWFNKWWVYLIFAVILGGAVQLAAYKPFTAIRSFDIPSASMSPTLKVGDYLFADPYAYKNKAPTRGDVVILKLPSNPKVDFVERVIGLPGDTVQFKNGQIFLNGQPLKILKIGKITETPHKQPVTYTIQRETLPSGQSYLIYDKYRSSGDDTKIFHIPADHYFVVGDNRDNSLDSRFPETGFIPRENIYAQVKIIYYSKSFSRIGTVVK